ncbi:hypothetical protein [Sphaerisporangium rhizosphaerae]|uniref:Protein kinase domain-containing protein n=1 Tax=Sphaerisporangium rhizosphaerae TaxID=2269375 RepID=A0ABW2NUZ9_9ACTN
MSGTGFGVGERPIDFLAHHQRRGEAGAREDFEQMLVSLVSAVTGQEAALVRANPGDWGIDVLVGDLNGSVEIWQSKYFIKEFGESQKKQVRESFDSAMRHAAQEGHTVTRWVLCIPCAMDARTLKWWHGWRARLRAEHQVEIELWDENGLRSRLDLPQSVTVRRAYYDPYRPVQGEDPPPVVVADHVITAPAADWRGGAEVRVGDACYLLHDELVQDVSKDHAWVWREATADQIEPAAVRVRLRQVAVLRETPGAEAARRAMRVQAELLTALAGARGLPRLLAVHENGAGITTASALGAGPTWRAAFGPGLVPLDRVTVADVLAAAARLCEALAELHRHGHAHRMVGPDTVVMTGRDHEPALRDIGLVAWPPRPGEGPDGCRAPEQARVGVRGRAPGTHTDVHQLAALVYHTVSGHPPMPGGSPPIRATVPWFPAALDELLAQALDVDPARRPRRIAVLGAALSRARREVSRGGHA